MYKTECGVLQYVTAPRSQRQTEVDPGEPGRPKPHIWVVCTRPSQQEKERGPTGGPGVRGQGSVLRSKQT